MKKRLRQILTGCMLLFTCCIAVHNNSDSVEDVLQYCDFIEKTEIFEMRILDHIPSCSCGSMACASNTIGIVNEKDTIRVLSLCYTDTNLLISEIIKVIPHPPPSFKVKIAQYWISDGKKIHLPTLQRIKLKTTYGSIIKK